MAGQGRKEFDDGDVLSAADVNGYLMDQSVMRFADSSARTAAIGTPTEGMVSYLDDTNDVEVFDGTDWVNFTGDITNVTAGTGLTGGGSEGSVTLDVDYTEVVENVITSEGDLIIGDASGDPVRLPVGAADQVLTSDGTTVSFQDAAGGGLVELANIDVNVSTGTQLDINNISGDYKNLYLILDNDFSPDEDDGIRFTLNNQTTNYYKRLFGDSARNGYEEDFVSPNGFGDIGKESTANFVYIPIINYTRNSPKWGNVVLEAEKGNERFFSTPWYFCKETAPITSIQLFWEKGNNFYAGTVRLFGEN